MSQNSFHTYTVGQTAVITGTFLDENTFVGLTLSNLELRIQPPSPASEIDIVGVSSFQNPSPGVYTYNQFLNAIGVWNYRWVSSGTYASACEGSLTVSTSPFTFPP